MFWNMIFLLAGGEGYTYNLHSTFIIIYIHLAQIIFTTLYTAQLHISVGQAMISMVNKAEYRVKKFIKQ